MLLCLPGHILSVRTVQLPLGKVDSISQVQVSQGMAEESVLNMASTCHKHPRSVMSAGKKNACGT